MLTKDEFLKNWHPFKPELNDVSEAKANNSVSDAGELSKEKKPEPKAPVDPDEDKPLPGSFEDKYGVII